VSAARRIAKVAVGTGLAAVFVLGCSWDNPVWPKNAKSDTPLFRFVIHEKDGAGYIDRDGKVIIKRPCLTSATTETMISSMASPWSGRTEKTGTSTRLASGYSEPPI
jgi:hypothetical protein